MKKFTMVYILIISMSSTYLMSIIDCDSDNDCRGLSASYKCNSRNQCEDMGGNDFDENGNGGDYCNID